LHGIRVPKPERARTKSGMRLGCPDGGGTSSVRADVARSTQYSGIGGSYSLSLTKAEENLPNVGLRWAQNMARTPDGPACLIQLEWETPARRPDGPVACSRCLWRRAHPPSQFATSRLFFPPPRTAAPRWPNKTLDPHFPFPYPLVQTRHCPDPSLSLSLDTVGVGGRRLAGGACEVRSAAVSPPLPPPLFPLGIRTNGPPFLYEP